MQQAKIVQRPQNFQVTRPRTAIIVKGNPRYIEGNPKAHQFYNQLAEHLRKHNYAVSFDEGKPHTLPPKADLWVGHSRGASRLQWAPKGVKTIAIGAYGGVNHPLDRAFEAGQVPDIFHFTLSKGMKNQIDGHIQKKADINPTLAGGGLRLLGGTIINKPIT